MSTSHQHWLLEQLPEWEREGLLTKDASRTLRERYPVDASQHGIAQIAMGSLGALLIGSGLIAIIAFNWDDFTRPVRLLFAFLPLLLTQLVSLRVLQRGEAVAVWIRESAALLAASTTGRSKRARPTTVSARGSRNGCTVWNSARAWRNAGCTAFIQMVDIGWSCAGSTSRFTGPSARGVTSPPHSRRAPSPHPARP